MILMTRGRAEREPLEARLAVWQGRTPTAALSDRKGRHDRYSVALTNGDGADVPGLLERASEALWLYDIYPPRRMRSLVCSPDHRVSEGALIIQRIIFGPTAVEAAVRVVELFGPEGPVIGFSYVTLQGHAESGVATFFVARDDAGSLTFNIESWSRASGGVSTLMAPLSRRLQMAFTQEALIHFRRTVRARGAPA
jgi:uncharacterized protein (UPF0548 family)